MTNKKTMMAAKKMTAVILPIARLGFPSDRSNRDKNARPRSFHGRFTFNLATLAFDEYRACPVDDPRAILPMSLQQDANVHNSDSRTNDRPFVYHTRRRNAQLVQKRIGRPCLSKGVPSTSQYWACGACACPQVEQYFIDVAPFRSTTCAVVLLTSLWRVARHAFNFRLFVLARDGRTAFPQNFAPGSSVVRHDLHCF